eukprot:CAMPEP_0116035154 /NCGR_PEP_ID=MMETSP0321-20121206/20130_1 /TAXON_ID=163516 /ORGANISM="Leptocylindrus danicus var. danicus, Strain B650" /LENGTH=482 /DNA_ID=CAMNT_0003511795 /DNA_START=393 /DNA_END=1841 /DNA_ORIENTATION=+
MYHNGHDPRQQQYPPQQYPPQGPPHGYPPQGYPPQQHQHQQYGQPPPHGYPPQPHYGHPQQPMPPHMGQPQPPMPMGYAPHSGHMQPPVSSPHHQQPGPPAAPDESPSYNRGQGIVTPHPHDVLCGRGGATNNHVGNANYRKLVNHNKRLYITCPKRHKIIVSRSIVEAVRRQNPSGRFLIKEGDGMWYDIGHQKALEKTSQALREGATEIRKELEAQQSTSPQDKKKQSVKPQEVGSNNAVDLSVSKTESEDSNIMPPPAKVKPSNIRSNDSVRSSGTRRSSMKKPVSDDVSMASRSRKSGVVWDEESINSNRSRHRNRNDGLNDGERDALARLNRLKPSKTTSSSSSDRYGTDSASAYEPTPMPSGDSWNDGISSVPSITFSDLGFSLGSFGMDRSHRSGQMNVDNIDMNDDMSIGMIANAVFGSSRSIGMNSEGPSLGSHSRDWSKAKDAMSYDELSQMMDESIKSFQSLGLNGTKDDL